MPDNFLLDAITARMPEFNQDVVDGLAYVEMEHVESYIDRVWQCVQPDLPEGLVYEGIRRLTPKEEYLIRAKRGQSNASIEIARSNIYMVEFQLSWKGQRLPPCYTSLPIIEDGGIMYIRGSMCAIYPVLADVAVSVGTDYIFIPIFRDRIKYYRHQHHFKVDGVQKAVYVVWSNIHHEIKRTSMASLSKVKTTLAHYLFAQYGVTETLRKYAHVNIKIGNSETITREQFSKEDWVLLSSIHRRPVKLKDSSYVYPDLVIAVPRPEYNETAENILAALFYAADYFPRRVVHDEIDEPYLWVTLLGVAIWGSGMHEGQLADKVQGHLRSLSGYIDNEARKDLLEDGLNVQDIYDLFVYLIDNFTRRIVDAYPTLPSMYNKKLMVLRYVMKDIVRSINLFMYRLKATDEKKQITAKDITDRLTAEINQDRILDINSMHGEVDTGISSPGDNKYFKITSRIVKQVNSSGRSSSGSSMTDPSNFLHPSIAECGSYLTPSGSSPTGHERINPCILLSPTRTIVRREEVRELLDDIERRIRRT